ncbi:MAG: hypothetical protein M3552_18940, partial [Planctomycetota bacterium]|nr:hypothetical protein [Planctomycetota bacterium]
MIDVRPNENATVSFTHEFAEPGPHGVEVRLPSDALAADNSRYLSVTARGRLRVLLVNGRPAGRPEQTATFYLRQALSPETDDASATQSDFEPTVIDEGGFSDHDLAGYDAVVLSNVGIITDREADRLRAFAAAGGGVVLALGDNVRPEAYNRLLADAEGDAMLPVRLIERVGNPSRPQEAMRFDTSVLTHPIVSPFAGNPGTGLDTDFTLAYAKAELAGNATVEVPLRFESGDPAIIAASAGAGRILLSTTSVDTTWGGPWPQAGRSFLPLMHEMVRYAATGRPPGLSVDVGEPLVWTLPERIAGLTATVTGPGDLTTSVAATVDRRGTTILFDATERPGIYTMALGAPIEKTELFAVNVEPSEGDLTALSEQERMALVSGAKPFIPGSNGTMTSAALPDWTVSRWLLAVAFGLLLAEQILAWRFAWGLLALAAVACALLFRWAWIVDPYLGTALAVVSLIGFVVWVQRLRSA